jgi:hypothetical protein
LNQYEQAIPKLRDLILRFHFSPVIELSHKLIGESLFLLAQIDLSIISDMVKHTGFQLSTWNDAVMERLLSQAVPKTTVKSFLDIGFVLSDTVIKRTIAYGKPFAFELLMEFVEKDDLIAFAENTVYDLFGPYLNRDVSLNVAWNSNALQRIVRAFQLSDKVIEKALLNNPLEKCTFENVHTNFPVTRPYLKSRPYAIWRWILDNYGPHHRFSIACFDDAISRAVADESLHSLIDVYLEQGMILRPRHVKIIACRVLHRNMTSNGLLLMTHLRYQVIERYRKAMQFQHMNDFITQIQETEIRGFQKALCVDILENEDWKQKSRTMQLAGGAVGGTFRIERTPSDVVQFTEQAIQLQKFLNSCDFSQSELDLKRERKPKSSLSDMSIFKKIKLYFKLHFRWFKRSTVAPKFPF